MSVKFDAPSATRSKEMFLADPYEIDLDSSLRGRHDIPSDEKIREMADSIRRVGQLEAITTRKLPSGKVQVIYGYTRLLACRLLKDEDPEFKIRFTVETNVNDQDAFTRAVTENLVRNETTLIDTAYNLQRFMDVYGWNAARCAEFYRFGNQSKVTQIRAAFQPYTSMKRWRL
jgi:ParB-like chromosome segregation protein Spo0J